MGTAVTTLGSTAVQIARDIIAPADMTSTCIVTSAASVLFMPKIKDGQQWGPWRLDAKTLELVFVGQGNYRIDLETIKDAPNMLNWIFHMREKEAWVTNDVMEHLLIAFRDLFKPLVHSTSYGKIDPKKHLQQLLQ